MHDHIADKLRVLASEVGGPARLLGLAVRTDQFDFAIDRAFDPVVVNLGALMPHAHQHAAGSAVDIVVSHPEDGIRIGHFVVLHVDRVARGSGAGVRDLAVFQRERSGVLVRAEDAVRRTIADHRVADGDSMRLAENAGAGTAANLESLEHDVVRALELDRMVAALQQRARLSDHPPPADGHRGRRAPAIVAADHDVAAVGRIAVDLDDIAGLKIVGGEDRGQLRVLTARWTDGVGSSRHDARRKQENGCQRTDQDAHRRIIFGGKDASILAARDAASVRFAAHSGIRNTNPRSCVILMPEQMKKKSTLWLS